MSSVFVVSVEWIINPKMVCSLINLKYASQSPNYYVMWAIIVTQLRESHTDLLLANWLFIFPADNNHIGSESPKIGLGVSMQGLWPS